MGATPKAVAKYKEGVIHLQPIVAEPVVRGPTPPRAKAAADGGDADLEVKSRRSSLRDRGKKYWGQAKTPQQELRRVQFWDGVGGAARNPQKGKDQNSKGKGKDKGKGKGKGKGKQKGGKKGGKKDGAARRPAGK